MNTNQPTERGQWTSASAAERDRHCPGAHLACLGLPESTSEGAQKGREIHAWLHWKRSGGKPMDMTYQEQEWVVGEPDPDTEPVCDYELAGRCWDLEQQAIQDWLARKSESEFPEFKVYSEKRLWLSAGTLKHSGQCDCAVVSGNRVLILDVKTGWQEVAAPASNEQLRDLAVLWWWETQCDEVTVQIIQPGVEKQPPCVYGREELEESHRRLVARVVASNDPNAKRVPGEVQCQYCRAKGSSRCPETQQAVVTLPPLPVAEIPSPKLVEAALMAQGVAKAILEAARAALKDNPDAIPGFKLEPNAPNKPITDPGACWARCSTQGMTLEQFMTCVKVGKGDLEAALKEVIRAKTGKKRVEGWTPLWLKLLEGITTEEPKEPSIKRV